MKSNTTLAHAYTLDLSISDLYYIALAVRIFYKKLKIDKRNPTPTQETFIKSPFCITWVNNRQNKIVQCTFNFATTTQPKYPIVVIPHNSAGVKGQIITSTKRIVTPEIVTRLAYYAECIIHRIIDYQTMSELGDYNECEKESG